MSRCFGLSWRKLAMQRHSCSMMRRMFSDVSWTDVILIARNDRVVEAFRYAVNSSIVKPAMLSDKSSISSVKLLDRRARGSLLLLRRRDMMERCAGGFLGVCVPSSSRSKIRKWNCKICVFGTLTRKDLVTLKYVSSIRTYVQYEHIIYSMKDLLRIHRCP